MLSLVHPDPASRPTVDSIVQSQLLLALHKSIRSQRSAAGATQGLMLLLLLWQDAHCPKLSAVGAWECILDILNLLGSLSLQCLLGHQTANSVLSVLLQAHLQLQLQGSRTALP